MKKKLYSIREASEETGLPFQNLYYRVMNKQIRSVSLPTGKNRIFIPNEEVQRIKAGQRFLERISGNKNYLTPFEAGRILRMDRVHLYQFLLNDRIKAIRCSQGGTRKLWFIPRSSVEELKKKKGASGLFSLQEATRILGTSDAYIRKIIADKKLETLKVWTKRGHYISPETLRAIKAVLLEEKKRLSGFISLRDAALRLGITRQALYQHLSNGHLKGFRERTGGKKPRVYFSHESLREFIRRSRRDSLNRIGWVKVPGTVTPREASRISRLSMGSIYNFIRNGKLASERTPGRPGSRGWIVIQREALNDFLRKYASKIRRRSCPSCKGDIRGAFHREWKFCPFCGQDIEKRKGKQ